MLAGGMLLTGCFKEKSVEPKPEPETPEHPWRFEVGAKAYSGSVDVVRIDSVSGAAMLTVSGMDAAGKGRITLQVVAADLAPGTYLAPSIAFAYTEDANPVYQSDGSAGDFSITLSTVNENEVAGTFSGTIRLTDSSTATLSNGSFSGTR